MLDMEIVAVCSEIQTKQINIFCRKNVGYFKDKFSGTYIEHWVFSGFIVILTNCTKEIKGNWPCIYLLTYRRKLLYLYHATETSVTF